MTLFALPTIHRIENSRDFAIFLLIFLRFIYDFFEENWRKMEKSHIQRSFSCSWSVRACECVDAKIWMMTIPLFFRYKIFYLDFFLVCSSFLRVMNSLCNQRQCLDPWFAGGCFLCCFWKLNMATTTVYIKIRFSYLSFSDSRLLNEKLIFKKMYFQFDWCLLGSLRYTS